MDITPDIPAGRQFIESYGDGGFRVSGQRYEGNIIVTPTATWTWDVDGEEALSLYDFSIILDHSDEIDILLVGTGNTFQPVPLPIKQGLRDYGISTDVMDTGGACRTYNVVMSEDRLIAVALMAVD